jgi:hypothetical protein
MVVGKMTGNETKVQEGKDKVHPAGRGSEGDTTHPDHPGITYTKSGAMKQINMQRPPPPPPSDSKSVTDDIQQPSKGDHPGISFTKSGAMKQTCFKPPQHAHEESKWTADTEGTYDFGNNFDSHPHENYAGPNLTKTLASPAGDDADLAIVQEKQGQEERYDLLHGGFPTGAPSPGLRGRGPEVVDKFDK